jgi:hypothetical protein
MSCLEGFFIDGGRCIESQEFKKEELAAAKGSSGK